MPQSEIYFTLNSWEHLKRETQSKFYFSLIFFVYKFASFHFLLFFDSVAICDGYLILLENIKTDTVLKDEI